MKKIISRIYDGKKLRDVGLFHLYIIIFIAFILSAGCSSDMAGSDNAGGKTAISVNDTGSDDMIGKDRAVAGDRNVKDKNIKDKDVKDKDVKGKDAVREISSAGKAEYLYDKIIELYGIKGQSLFLEHYPSLADDRAVSFLWPFSGMFSAVNALGKLEGMKEKYERDLPEVMAGLEKYRDDLRQPAAYQSYPFEFGGDDRFYDDNMWLGLDFAEAYGLTGDRGYLEKAAEIFEFVKSGWSEELGGGIYWCEQKKESKNTCSNGPAAVLALKLYRLTGDGSYLDWGLKIYEWTRRTLQSPEGVYWDNINLQRVTDKTAYAYNSGTMLNAAVLLYQITGDGGYLKEAQRVAKAGFDRFAPANGDGIRFFPDRNPWFTVILFRGYQALYEVDRDPVYIKAVAENIDYAWEHARDENGLISRDWSGRSSDDRASKWLLDEACMVEFYAGIAQWEAEGGK